jgi:hypothetical protein
MSHVIAVRLSEGEWSAFQQLRDRHNVTAQQLLHAIVIDALVEDGWDALRRRESEGCESAGETSEVGGDSAP